VSVAGDGPDPLRLITFFNEFFSFGSATSV